MIHLRLRGKMGTALLFVFWVPTYMNVPLLHTSAFAFLPPALEFFSSRATLIDDDDVGYVVVIKYWSDENLSTSKILASLKKMKWIERAFSVAPIKCSFQTQAIPAKAKNF